MDGKRIFQERTNIVNWADTVKNSSSVPLSKSRLKRIHSHSYTRPTGTEPASLPLTKTTTLRKVSTTPISQPTMQISKAKDGPIDVPTISIQIPEVVQSSSPVRTPLPRSRELPQGYPKEASAEELQIRALKRAMSVLNTHIADSKDRVSELRRLLAERDIEPELFKTMQRQRWMEEKRQIATDHLSKIVEQHLVSSSTTSRTEGGWGGLNSDSRSSMNLAMFFESPRQRIPTKRSRVRRGAHVGPQPRQEGTTSVRSIHHHKGVIPLVLKPSPHVPPFLKNRPKTKKSDSLPVKPRITSQTSPLKPKPSANALAQLPAISEIPESSKSTQAHISGDSADASGSAIIWRDSPRTKEEILSGFVVNMPDYVDELLAEFDAQSFAPTTALNALQEPKSSQPTISKATSVHETPKPQQQRTLGVPPPVHKSPSRKRISALFSLADAISPRKVALVNADSSDRTKPLTTTTPPTSSTSAIAEEPTRPFSVSFSALPSSESGGSHEKEADFNLNNTKRTSRLGHRLSFFKRH